MFGKRIRAWHKEKKAMSKILNIDFEDETITVMGSMYGLNQDDVRIYDFKDVILMQETGMVDDLKFNIFEGDIIVFEDEFYTIKYGDYGDSNKGTNGFGWHIASTRYTHPYMGGGKKVGNIYENPEIQVG